MVYAIRADGLTREEFAFAVFLQGGVNRRGRRLLLDVDNYLSYITEDVKYLSLAEAAGLFLPEFCGLAVFDLGADDVSVNLAATVCAAEDLLGVPRGFWGWFRARRSCLTRRTSAEATPAATGNLPPLPRPA